MDDVSSTRVAAYLREAILSGDLGPGDRIRQEDVAERLGTSRVPVREALRMLAAEGLTEHEAHKGARVPRLSQHEVDVVYQMRERLEPLALIESMAHLGPTEHEQLEQVQRRIEENDDLEKFLDLDREFHMLTYSGCHLESLTGMVTPPVELHPAPPAHLRRPRRPQPDVGGQLRAPADPRRRRAP